MAKVVMTLLIRDEEDILEANLAFHLAQGVERFIVMDHLSSELPISLEGRAGLIPATMSS